MIPALAVESPWLFKSSCKQRNTKDRQQPPEARIGKEGSSLEPSERACPCRHLDFQIPGSRAVSQEISVQEPTWWYFVTAP